MPYKGETYPGQHEALIDAATWATVQRVNDSHARDYLGWQAGGKRLLSGLLRCGDCGGAMTYNQASPTLLYVRCARYTRSGGKECTHQTVRADEVHDQVRAQVREVAASPQAHIARLAQQHTTADYADRLIEIERGLAELATQEQRLVAAIATGRFPLEVLASQQDTITAQRAALAAESTRLHADAARLDNARHTVNALASQFARFDDLTDTQLREMYRQLIYRVVVKRGTEAVILWSV